MSRISSKNQVTLPIGEMRRAGLKTSDEVEIIADDEGCIVIRRAEPGIEGALGIFDGLYEPDYLENLRKDERF